LPPVSPIMARTKSRTIQVHPEIEPPPNHLTLAPPAAPALSASPNGLKKGRKSLLETVDFPSKRDQTYLENNITPKRNVSMAVSPRSYHGSQNNYAKDAQNAETEASMSCPNCNAGYDAADLQVCLLSFFFRNYWHTHVIH
jgi:hypothetical protein